MTKRKRTKKADIVQRDPASNPIGNVQWVDPATLRANDYNPNHVFGPEFALLKRSLISDGWTQPVVVREDMEIVDGFHRWTLAKNDPEVAALGGGLLPVVVLAGKTDAEQMLSTVRHNRARGQHGILKMASIVRQLEEEGLSSDDVAAGLGMEEEERQRLTDQRSSPDIQGEDSFGRGWRPRRDLG